MLRILIADDNPKIRNSVIHLLSEGHELFEFHEVENGHEVLQKLSSEEFDCLIMDINMPGKSGIEVLKCLNQNAKKTPVIIISMLPEDPYSNYVKKYGAAFIEKNELPEKLENTVSSILAGKLQKAFIF